ncbi:dTDP-4-dehydrorhamnose reductase [Streptomyces spiroverticillatus]|uniref:dTDP-4-dehydrorhamnose reductase n=1 Tax=Streptomyces finlayi TaxID=67296 RepID=A0A918X667_9ACTN|nr:sugar nucleotide-binding protein [Streptomyces finlayi]GHA30001.1 dTDP-4-dehydrorhamnose reductase [Streptomyces spiroverticillatus]GHD15155.1 dTDP-4-dehydrorhamnose reductase [Streptomyces finlayi]
MENLGDDTPNRPGRTMLLIIGGSGYLGSGLIRRAAADGHDVVATYATKPSDAEPTAWRCLDLRDVVSVENLLDEVNPHAVINASSGLADWAITAEGPIPLALATARRTIRLVHVSSDAVFSGDRVHYDESCSPDPITPYGAAKAAAETGVLAVHPAAAVARTSLIIGDAQSEHERLVHQLIDGTADGALFTDDIRCPVHRNDLAAALLEVAFSSAAGILHIAGPDALSRHELGVLIAHRDGLDASHLATGLRAESSLPGALDVRLDSRAAQQQLRTRLRGAREFLSPAACPEQDGA